MVSSPTYRTETIYVRLVDEAVDMWRPVEGYAIDERLYRLVAEQNLPDDEQWEFGRGEIVAVEAQEFEGRIQLSTVSAEQRSSL